MKYDFDKVIDRRGTDAKKFDPSMVPNGVLPFWVADTEFESPIEVKDAMMKRLELGHFGYPYYDSRFEESVARWYKVRHKTELNPKYIDFSPCVIPALIWAVNEFSSVGDKVLLQTPVYHMFHLLIKNTGRQLIFNEMLLKDDRYEIDFEDLERKLKKPDVKVMFICNPQNPVGKVFTREELTKIGNLCIENNVMIVVDEVHADIIYDKKEFLPFCSISEKFANNSITFINPAKTFNIAGLRTAAWFTHNENIYNRMMNQQNYTKNGERTILGVEGFIAAYTYGDEYADQCLEYLQDTRDAALKYIKENIPSLKVIAPEATFLMWLNFRELGFKTQKELKDFLLNKAKVLLSDGVTFGAEGGFGHMRFNFGDRREVVLEGLRRIKVAIDELKK